MLQVTNTDKMIYFGNDLCFFNLMYCILERKQIDQGMNYSLQFVLMSPKLLNNQLISVKLQ